MSIFKEEFRLKKKADETEPKYYHTMLSPISYCESINGYSVRKYCWPSNNKKKARASHSLEQSFLLFAGCHCCLGFPCITPWYGPQNDIRITNKYLACQRTNLRSISFVSVWALYVCDLYGFNAFYYRRVCVCVLFCCPSFSSLFFVVYWRI